MASLSVDKDKKGSTFKSHFHSLMARIPGSPAFRKRKQELKNHKNNNLEEAKDSGKGLDLKILNLKKLES
jgi:hypothetical protein